MTALYLVRHGETDWNAARRIQGSTDIPLNDVGRDQARRTGRLLASRQWDGIWSSPLSRAFETAEIIAEQTGLGTPIALDAVVERNYGAAEGMDYRTIDRRFPEGTHVPGRESRRRVAARVMPALIALAAEHEGENLIVTTHGGVIRAVVTSTAAHPERFNGVRITNGSVHSFRYVDGALELVAFDDPIEAASVDPRAPDFDEQNAVAAQEDRESSPHR